MAPPTRPGARSCLGLVGVATRTPEGVDGRRNLRDAVMVYSGSF